MKKWMWLAGIPVTVLASNWVVNRSGDWEDTTNWQNGIIPNYGVERAVFNGTYTDDVLIKVGEPPMVQMEVNYAGGKTVTLEGASAEARHLIHTNATLNFSEGHVVLNNLDMDFLFPGNHALNVSADANKAAGRYSFLDLMGDSRLYLAGNLLIAGGNSPGGRVTVSDTATLAPQYLFVGRGTNAQGGLLQWGGTVAPWTELSIAHNADTVGVYEMFDGKLNVANNVTAHMSVNAGCMGAFYQHGGETDIGTGGIFIMGDSSGSRSDVFIDGGTFRSLRNASLTHRAKASAEPADNTFTVMGAGDASFYGNFILYGNHYAEGDEVAQVNLVDGGSLFVRGELRQYDSSTAGKGYVAFNGGTYAKNFESTEGNIFQNLEVSVYAGGATIRSDRRKTPAQTTTIQVAHPNVHAAKGWGVASISLTDPGEGYILPPAVTISGGSGRRATAIAQLDYEAGCVTNVIVTCPGEDFEENDVVTVTFLSGTPAKIQPTRAAAATATLAKNTMGPIRVSGELPFQFKPKVTVDNVTEIVDYDWPTTFSVIEGGTVHAMANRFNSVTNVTIEGTLDIGSGLPAENDGVGDRFPTTIPVTLGGYRSSESKLLLCGSTADGGFTSTQTFADLTLAAGKDSIGLGHGEGAAEITIGSFAAREAGALFYAKPDDGGFALHVGGVANALLSGTASPIVIGAIAANTSNESLGELVTYDAANRTFAPLAQYDTAFGPDANAELSGSVAATDNAVNSLLMNNGTTLSLSQKTAVNSGMVIFRDGSNASRITGGELTTGNGKDLILHDMHVKGRRATEANYAVIESKIVDADASHPTALVVSGYRNATGSSKVLLKTGPSVQLTNTANTYSGGTFLNDAAIDVMDDGALGAVPAEPGVNIVAQGISQIRAKNGKGQLTLNANRGIHIARDAVFSFTGDRGAYQVTTTVNGPLSGHGALISAEWAGGGKAGVVELNGDVSAFHGIYIPMGNLRIPDASKISPRARFIFGENDDLSAVGEGILETQGTIVRPVGCEPGMVFWGTKQRQIPDLANRDPGTQISGGFAAYGGPLTVSILANDRVSELKWGTSEDYHKFTPKVLRLQNGDSTHPLYWTAGVNFDGATRVVDIGRKNANAEVYWSGRIYNDNGSATFQKQGEGQLILTDGANIASTATTSITLDIKKGSLHFDVTNLLTSTGTLLTTAVADSTVEKRGVGTVRLAGTSTFVNLAVKAGLLELAGEGTSAASITVDADAALHGSGAATVTEEFSVNGEVSAVDADGIPATLAVAGLMTIDGTAVSELTEEKSSLITVDGNLEFGSDAKVEIPQVDLLAAREEPLTLMTATGTITGCPEGIDLPKGWKIRVRQTVVEAAYVPGGTVIILR